MAMTKWASLASLIVLAGLVSARAEDEEAVPDTTPDPRAVVAEKIGAFQAALRPVFSTPFDELSQAQKDALAEKRDAVLSTIQAIVDDPKTSQEVSQDVQGMKLRILSMYSGYDTSWKPKLASFQRELIKTYPKSELAALAAAYAFLDEYIKAEDVQPDKLTKALTAYADSYADHPYVGDLYMMAGNKLVEEGETEKAVALYKDGIERLKGSPKVQMLEGLLTKLDIIGKPMEIVGPTLTGSDFDLDSLRGKVVLVDFWATWCGPCIHELPNVRKAYDEYHEQGFEIVAISLDNDREKLEKFVADKEIPWTQIIFSDESEMGWQNPLARKYGVNAIPATFLIGRDGKVAAVDVRGPDVSKRVLAELKKHTAPTAN